MNADSLAFLKNLMKQPSPSGFEVPAQKVIRARMQNVTERVAGDVHGNLIGALNEKARVKVMLAGHVDEIGLMVNHIDEKGFLRLNAVGGKQIEIPPFHARVAQPAILQDQPRGRCPAEDFRPDRHHFRPDLGRIVETAESRIALRQRR